MHSACTLHSLLGNCTIAGGGVTLSEMYLNIIKWVKIVFSGNILVKFCRNNAFRDPLTLLIRGISVKKMFAAQGAPPVANRKNLQSEKL